MLHDLWLVLFDFITPCDITPEYDDRTVSCAITHFPFACIENYIATWNAINIHFGKSHINQLRRATGKTSLAVPGSASRGPLPAERCDLGSIFSVFCHWFPWLIPAPTGHQTLPLDLKPIIWWWSRSGGCECDACGGEDGGNRINHRTVSEKAFLAVYFFSLLSLLHHRPFSSHFCLNQKHRFKILIEHNLSGSMLCFCELTDFF